MVIKNPFAPHLQATPLTRLFHDQIFRKSQGGLILPAPSKISFQINRNGCWICVDRFIDKDGYPRCRDKGQNVSAARFIYTRLNGSIPKGQVVRHKCGNPACINPGHLELGSQADNMADRDAQGRTAIGIKNGRAKLTVAKVRKIRESGDAIRELAKKHGVDYATIRAIQERKIWKTV